MPSQCNLTGKKAEGAPIRGVSVLMSPLPSYSRLLLFLSAITLRLGSQHIAGWIRHKHLVHCAGPYFSLVYKNQSEPWVPLHLNTAILCHHSRDSIHGKRTFYIPPLSLFSAMPINTPEGWGLWLERDGDPAGSFFMTSQHI